MPKLSMSQAYRSLFRLGLGGMGLNGGFGSYDDPYMIRSILVSLEQGVNFIDTARGYGRSEELIGKALKQWPGDKPFIASKTLPQRLPAQFPVGSGFHLPAPVP